jgi:hypothetical protein
MAACEQRVPFNVVKPRSFQPQLYGVTERRFVAARNAATHIFAAAAAPIGYYA